MSSIVDICNMALANIRASGINSLDESSIQAQQCKLKYKLLKDQLLREIPWQFARTLRALALLETDERFTWSYKYKYPVDCLQVGRIIHREELLNAGDGTVVSRFMEEELLDRSDLRRQIPFEVYTTHDGKVIGTDQSQAYIDYTVRIEDSSTFSSAFTLALSHLLASEIAIPIVGAELGRALRSDSVKMYQNYLASAIAADVNDGYHNTPESDFITVRR